MQVSNSCLDVIFRKARTQNAWQNAHVPDGTLEAIYDLMKWGPTSFNSNPVRIVFCASPDSKKKLADCAREGNQAKIIAAPVTAIIAFDTQYYELMPKLCPPEHVEQIIKMYKETEGLIVDRYPGFPTIWLIKCFSRALQSSLTLSVPLGTGILVAFGRDYRVQAFRIFVGLSERSMYSPVYQSVKLLD